jgi:predicted N-formylglutamate amidohydrolase
MINDPKLTNKPYTVNEVDNSNIILLCDHASQHIPSEYNGLGLSEKLLNEHISYDIGAAKLTNKISEKIRSNSILSNFSRLLIDPNRGIDDPTLIMKFADQFIIPGNLSLTSDHVYQRIESFYKPYHNQIMSMINNLMSKNEVPILISIHSFTRNFRSDTRPWEISVLWDTDDRISSPMLSFLRMDNKYIIGDNEPYKGYLKGDTLYTHGTTRGIPHVLIEVRNDLIANNEGQKNIAEYLADIIERIINKFNSQINNIQNFGTRTF